MIKNKVYMNESEAIALLENILYHAKNYEYAIRNSFSKIKNIDKDVLIKIKKNSPKVQSLLDDLKPSI